jgi:hypothetical protein
MSRNRIMWNAAQDYPAEREYKEKVNRKRKMSWA